MNDGYPDIYDDDIDTEDASPDAEGLDDADDGGDDAVSDSSGPESPGQDSSDGAPGSDGADEQDTETDGEESAETGDRSDGEETQTPEEGAEDAEGEAVEGEEDETEAFPIFDPEILFDIRDSLHEHSDTVNVFTSGLTVSGNSLQVSLDSGSSALLIESVDCQNRILEGIDTLYGMLLLLFLVLMFDLMQHSAKRIIKNFMGGDKVGNNP